MKKGSSVTAIGNPIGLADSVTQGHISNIDIDMHSSTNIIKCLQTDAAVNPGNSGGALLNESGKEPINGYPWYKIY